MIGTRSAQVTSRAETDPGPTYSISSKHPTSEFQAPHSEKPIAKRVKHQASQTLKRKRVSGVEQDINRLSITDEHVDKPDDASQHEQGHEEGFWKQTLGKFFRPRASSHKSSDRVALKKKRLCDTQSGISCGPRGQDRHSLSQSSCMSVDEATKGAEKPARTRESAKAANENIKGKDWNLDVQGRLVENGWWDKVPRQRTK